MKELRLVLTVDDFDAAVAFYRDALGLTELGPWEAEDGRIVILEAGRATLELVDEGQAAAIDAIEVGRRVAGPVRVALEVGNSDAAAEALTKPAASYSAGRLRLPGETATFACARPTECS